MKSSPHQRQPVAIHISFCILLEIETVYEAYIYLYMPKRSRTEGKNTQKNCTKKHLNELDNYYGVVSHPELDILQFEVKWALGSTASIKLVDVMEFQ